MTALWIPLDTPEDSRELGTRKNIFANLTGIRMTPALLCMLLSIGSLTAVMASVETYWAPALKALTLESPNVMLGVLSASSFLLLTVGSMAMGRLNVKSKAGRWNVYFTLQMLLGGTALILSPQRTALGFSGVWRSIGLFSMTVFTILWLLTLNLRKKM